MHSAEHKSEQETDSYPNKRDQGARSEEYAFPLSQQNRTINKCVLLLAKILALQVLMIHKKINI